jgi:hypothetical protein
MFSSKDPYLKPVESTLLRHVQSSQDDTKSDEGTSFLRHIHYICTLEPGERLVFLCNKRSFSLSFSFLNLLHF